LLFELLFDREMLFFVCFKKLFFCFSLRGPFFLILFSSHKRNFKLKIHVTKSFLKKVYKCEINELNLRLVRESVMV
jgi:hypothetical protein